MTKTVLKINCGDSNPPVLAENLPILDNFSSLLVSQTFNQSFKHDSLAFLAVFPWFLSHYIVSLSVS